MAADERPVQKFATLDTAPGYRRVANAIEAEIISGRLKSGDLLPIETDLAGQFGVHRSTVREGLRALENAGLVVRAGAKRLRVAVPAPDHLARDNARALGLSGASFDQLWEIQMQLEPFSARLAATRIPQDLARRLATNVAELAEHLDDDAWVIRNDIAFHRLVAEAAQNPVLKLSLAPASVLLFSATVPLYQTVPQARHRLLEAHRAILEAILSRDAETAAMWMTRHIRDFRRGYEAGGLNTDVAIPLDARALDLLNRPA